MKKNFHLLFWCLSLILVLQIPAIAQDMSKDTAPNLTPVKTNLPLQTVYNDNIEDLLYDNGPLVTLPGGGCSGGDASIVETAAGLTLYGWGAQQNLGNYMADDFINDAAWNIDSIMFYSYQTSATSSTITGVYVQIWDGSPMAGGTVVWGDLTTNLLQRTGLSNIYRALDTAPTDCARRQQEVVATIGTNLPAGQYWVQFGFTGTASSGPWTPPVTITGQTNTGDALQYTASSGAWAPALNGTFPNGAVFMVYGTAGAPVGPGQATNPTPADGAVDVDVDADLSWDNPAGATSIEVFFGPTGNMTSVYSGAPITTFDVGTMDYLSDYSWKVNETDGTGTTIGATWSFSTMQNPNLVTLMMDDFESGLGGWTVNAVSGCPWEVFTDPTITSRYQLPSTASGGILAADADNCGSSGGGSSGDVTFNTAIDASQYASVAVEWDNDWQALGSSDFAYCDVSTDGGSTWMNVVTFDVTDVRNTHEYYDISSMVGTQSFLLRFTSVQPAWDWWWAIDNVMVTGWDIIPVELSSFTANVSNGNVVLNWITATETNNKGFEVQRSSGSDYQTIAFIQGNGTSTQQHSYTYSDQNVTDGSYSYRLRQVDFDGSSAYSQVVEVNVTAPKVYSLAQNYPNPFNPTTQINFSLATDSKVTLKVFDILGQEVATLLNGNLLAGPHFVNFDASKLTSGVYLYRMDATGADGSNFTAIKKMLLTK